MVILKQYPVKEIVYSSKTSFIYRSETFNNKNAVIKVFKTEAGRLMAEQEYNLLRKIKLPGIVKAYDLLNGKDDTAIIFEDFGGITLENFGKNNKPDIKTFLEIAIKITEILGLLHRNNIIHKNLNPSNILINPENPGIVKIIDFGAAAAGNSEKYYTEGMIGYISPEQTGRINRITDYRSDFYALGITFYEMLFGSKPFDSENHTEQIHYHIAIMPKISKNKIPGPIADIILKLVSKNPEDRYQSSWGLKYDLEKCYADYLSQKIRKFKLGKFDLPDKLNLSDKIYGRTRETRQITRALEKCFSGIPGFIIISGYSGVGKTSLVKNALKNITADYYFCEGKFDQFQRHIPYLAVSKACTELVKGLLSCSEAELAEIKKALLDKLGENIALINELVPELEKITGKQTKAAVLSHNESQNRFQITFTDFINTVSEIKPIVFFIDDLQWSDIESINLLRHTTGSINLNRFLFIGSYRSSELHENHYANIFIKETEKNKDTIIIKLSTLNKTQTNQLIYDTLRKRNQKITTFSEIIYNKTKGNPFFIKEVLKSSYEQKLIRFDFENYCWQPDLERFSKVALSSNVAELVIRRLKKLSASKIEMLKKIACLGNRFYLKTLLLLEKEKEFRKVLSDSEHMINLTYQERFFADFSALITLEIITPAGGFDLNPADIKKNPGLEYKFSHDKIHQAAYELMNPSQKVFNHLAIARQLLKKLSEEEKEQKIIEIVQQYNHGISAIQKTEEKLFLSGLNLKAGKKAVAAAAYKQAREYFKAGKSLLSDSNWKDNYELAFELFRSYSECSYICGDFKEAETVSAILISKAKTKIEKAEIYHLQAIQYITTQNSKEALNSIKNGLSLFNQELFDSKEAVAQEYAEVWQNLGNRKVSDLAGESEISRQEDKMCILLLQDSFLPVYSLAYYDLLAYNILKATNMSLKHGVMTETSYVFNSFAILLGHYMGDMKTAFEFGKAALALDQRFESVNTKKAANLFTNTTFVGFWNYPSEVCVEAYKKVIETGLKTGDIIYTSYACSNITQWNRKLDLKSAVKEGKKYLELAQSLKFQDSIDVCLIFQNLRLNSLGETRDLYSLSNAAFDEEKALKRFHKCRNFLVTAVYHIYKTQPYFFYENYEKALYHIREAEKNIDSLAGQAHVSDFTLFAYLTFTAAYTYTELEKNGLLDYLEQKYRMMKKWSDNMPDNFLHLTLLMEAEMEKLKGNAFNADILYNKSVEYAALNGFLAHEALACELAGKLWLGYDRPAFAREYLNRAFKLYGLWGATVKAGQLKEKYNLETDTGTAKVNVDLETVIKYSGTLSEEINFNRLLKTLMKLLVENSGAQKAVVILLQNTKWFIEAEYNINDSEVIRLKPRELGSESTEATLPLSLIYYVINSGETIVISNGSEEHNLFSNEPYIKKQKPMSVLCLPLVNQGEIRGVIYLENKISAYVFSAEKQKILNLLSTQIAILINNSLLYEELEQRVNERTLALSEANKNLQELNYEKTELINMVTHNLRSPLSSILGFSSSINSISDLKKEEIETYSGQILLNSRRMLKMITDLLDISVIEDGNYYLKKENIDIVPLIDQLIFSYKEQLKAKNIKLSFQKSRASFRLNIDGNWLTQIIDNLLSNAVKFSEFNTNIFIKISKNNSPKGGPVSINSGASPGPNVIGDTSEQAHEVLVNNYKNKTVITVSDQGPGLSEADQERLFQKFVRLTPQPTNNESSSGLGLSIVKKMVEILGGKVYCKTKVGHGTSFILEFE